jgi:acyl-CoA thioesterase II
MRTWAMHEVVERLLNLLDLEQVDQNHFRGSSEDLGFKNVFGGQVVGQAMVAAYRTVENRLSHSMHGYFLRPGDANADIEYEVHCIRDGKSFTTRRVIATQHGQEIFMLAASFQTEEEGFEHQFEMPQVKQPEELVSELEMRRRFQHLIPEKVREQFTRESPIEIRPVNPMNYLAPDKRQPVKYNWFRAVSPLPDDPAVHQCILAYASDFGLLGTSLQPHGVTFYQRGMQVASLDHAIWFHRSFRADDWLLYAMDAPSASHGRGFNRGNIFDRQGRLVASVCQEALIRQR